MSKKAVKTAAKTAVKRNGAEESSTTAPRTVSFTTAKNELKNLRDKLQRILDDDGENPTVQNLIYKIDELDRDLDCRTNMTRSF